MNRFLAAFIVICALAIAATGARAGEVETGGYSIHYSALSAAVLPAAVVRQLGIKPAPTQGVINVTVLKDGDNVPANEVTGSAKALTGMTVPIAFHRITDASGESWLGTFTIPGTDTLRFSLAVTTADGATHAVTFMHEYVIR